MDSVTEQLIENIKKHRILYDLSHPEYKNNRSKNKIWDEIGSLLNIDGDEAKKRWKNIRDCYAKHLRSEKTHTGQQAKNINRYKSWPWAAQMSAFKPFLQFAQTTSNVDNVTRDEDVRNSQEIDHIIETETYGRNSDVDLSRTSAIIAEDSNMAPPTSQTNTTPQSSQSNITPQLSKKCAPKRKIQNNESSVSQVLSYLKNRNNSSEGTTYDDLDLLFLGHAKTIKKLSAKRQVIAKYRVAQVIMEEELHYLEETSAASSLPSTSSTNYNAPSPATSYQKSSTCESSNEYSNSPLYSYAATSPPESNNPDCHSDAIIWYESFSRTNL